MSVKVVGVEDIQKALQQIRANIENLEIATRPLAELMRQYVHVDTEYLKSTIDYQGNIAYADAIYAGVEADRGGSHDYASQAIGAFDIEAYADTVVGPF
jgi:hypothetical protein